MDVSFRQDQETKHQHALGVAPPRTGRLIRWTPASNRDEDHPAYSFPAGHSTTSFNRTRPPPLPPDPKGKGKKPEWVYHSDRPSVQHQVKRIVVVFGDGSFSASSPGKLAANFRLIRQKLKEKAHVLGCFPPDFPVVALRGKRRLVVLDIGENKTSVNYSDPTLPFHHDGHTVEHVRGIYAVVTHPKGSISHKSH